ncbi:MAG: FtsX-like permease family protein, partial [Paludibacteraceae bacterium]|nr:FtsX-like permease family protein [Paludibacteraceae bacterium]
HYFAVMGQGLAYTLGAGVYFIDPLYIYAPKSKVKVNIARPDNAFNQKGMFLSGIFAVNQSEYDSQYVIIDLELAQELFQYENLLTSIEIKLKDGANLERTEKKIQKILGDKFIVQNRHEQKVEFFKMMQIEKWITYLILSFILLIAIFNIIGSLTMLILDKKEDIKTLHSLGANDQTIRRIFLYEGWMISVIGAFIGIAVGVILVLLQQYIGIIRLSGSYVITYYPVRLAVIDLIIIFFTVVGLGFLASYYPTKFINKNKI